MSNQHCFPNDSDTSLSQSLMHDWEPNHDDYDDDDAYLASFPAGFRFRPFDYELVVCYLAKKVKNQPLPPNLIHNVKLYDHNPDTLAENYKAGGEREWYFFTPRERKYKNGVRPNRAAGDGFWKATGADKPIKFDKNIVGFKKVLVFYMGKPPKGEKTTWIMHEYRVDHNPPTPQKGSNDMRLDDWVLCKIYKKTNKLNDARNLHQVDDDRNQQTNNNDESQQWKNQNVQVQAASTMATAESSIPFNGSLAMTTQIGSGYIGNECSMGYFNQQNNNDFHDQQYLPNGFTEISQAQNPEFIHHQPEIACDLTYLDPIMMVQPISSQLPSNLMGSNGSFTDQYYSQNLGDYMPSAEDNESLVFPNLDPFQSPYLNTMLFLDHDGESGLSNNTTQMKPHP